MYYVSSSESPRSDQLSSSVCHTIHEGNRLHGHHPGCIPHRLRDSHRPGCIHRLRGSLHPGCIHHRLRGSLLPGCIHHHLRDSLLPGSSHRLRGIYCRYLLYLHGQRNLLHEHAIFMVYLPTWN